MFPTLPTMRAWRVPFFVTRARESDNGRRVSVSKRTVAGYTYTFEGSCRSWLNEDRDLVQFFEEHRGSHESFLLTDPEDGVVRRVHFIDDRLDGMKRERGGIYSGTFDLETVVS